VCESRGEVIGDEDSANNYREKSDQKFILETLWSALHGIPAVTKRAGYAVSLLIEVMYQF